MYENSREAFRVIVPNQALYRDQETHVILQPRHNRLTGVLDMNFSELSHFHGEISVHV